jgi:hypothetical protein
MIYRTRPSCRRTEGMLPRTSAPSTRATPSPRPSGRVHRARIPHSLFCAHTLAPTLAETCERRYRQGNAVRALARIGRAIDVCTRAVHALSTRPPVRFEPKLNSSAPGGNAPLVYMFMFLRFKCEGRSRCRCALT